MGAFKRWQDWVVVIAGLALIGAPFVFGETSDANVLWTVIVIGAVMAAGGLLASAGSGPGWAELIPAAAGIAAFFAPWIIGYTALTGTSWSSWIIGVLAVALTVEEVAFEQPSAVHHA